MPRVLLARIIVVLVALWPALAGAQLVQARFDLAAPGNGPFPSDWFTVPDGSHLTGRRVSLASPDCDARPSDCADVVVLNTLDGFNVQPRLSIPFTGPIDPATVVSDTVFLINLGDVTSSDRERERDRRSQIVGINQVVWDPTTKVLHVESDELLDQHTRYALIVTRAVRDAAGNPVDASPEFRRFRHGVRGDYKSALLDAMQAARHAGVPEERIAALSVFTTQSVTAALEKLRDQIKAVTPTPARFNLGTRGERTVFPLATVKAISFVRQTLSAPPGFSTAPVPLGGLATVPGAVGTLAFGSYMAPSYLTPERVLPVVGSRTGVPVAQGEEEIYFNLTLPSGTPPPDGWPVMIFGHGLGGTKNGAGLYLIAAKMAALGLAVIEINVVGHGGGPLGTLAVSLTDGSSVTLPAGGRGIDLDGDHEIGTSEGLSAIGAKAIVRSTDGLRQTVVDLMQLVRVIEVGMDVDGDGVADLDPSRIYYFGQSLGGNYGVPLHALASGVRASVINVAGGALIEEGRLGVNRPTVAQLLAARVPSLINGAGLTFDENIPLRDLPPVVNAVAGAMEIQSALENIEWVSQPSNPVAWSPYLRRQPLDDVAERPVLLHMARGDQTAPNPTNTAIIRAGELADVTTLYRHDLAVADNAARPRNPHLFPFLTTDPTMLAISLGIQEQIAIFAASDGHTVVHPTPEEYFEVPIVPPLPETLGFIP